MSENASISSKNSNDLSLNLNNIGIQEISLNEILINPEKGFVISCRMITGQVVYINVCHHPLVGTVIPKLSLSNHNSMHSWELKRSNSNSLESPSNSQKLRRQTTFMSSFKTSSPIMSQSPKSANNMNNIKRGSAPDTLLQKDISFKRSNNSNNNPEINNNTNNSNSNTTEVEMSPLEQSLRDNYILGIFKEDINDPVSNNNYKCSTYDIIISSYIIKLCVESKSLNTRVEVSRFIYSFFISSLLTQLEHSQQFLHFIH